MTLQHTDTDHTNSDAWAEGATLRVLALPGSLRRRSQNRGLLRAARELAPSGVDVRIWGLNEIPPYDGDVEDQGYPAPVRALQDAIREADALLIATPEYNGSVPGQLKNAIDWGSRPYSANALRHKRAAILGASPGRTRTATAQADLRRILEHLGASVLEEPRVLLSGSGGQFDAEGSLVDPEAREQVRDLVGALVRWVRPDLGLPTDAPGKVLCAVA